ncbi:hypothetical protein MKX01_038965 [Papaver californicum]|nr:hypothetical protein MKX01_038965 [Papaver californicum]
MVASFKPKASLIVFALMMFGFLLFYFSTSPFEGRLNTSIWKKSHPMISADIKELVKMLRDASMPDRTVIITTLNDAWAGPGSMIDLFPESFRIGKDTKKLVNHLVIVAMDERVLYPNSHDQAVFEIIKHDPAVNAMGLRIKYLDTAYFGGFCEPSKDMNKKKLQDLRLVLDNWKNFTALSTEDKILKGSSKTSPWSAPDKCKSW